MAKTDDKYVYTIIFNTGKGFPNEILQSIESDKPVLYDGFVNIVIRNTLQRIR